MQARIAARVIAALPLATPLKGSPTATPRVNDLHNSEIQIQSVVLNSSRLLPATGSDGSLFPQTMSSGAASFSPDQFITAEFADHAQQLRARLSPLASSEPAGLSATSSTTTATIRDAATAPPSPKGRKLPVIVEVGSTGNVASEGLSDGLGQDVSR
ncbi:hypothetical protein QFC22_000844 [Naganishia vaughanmartiniae]|uniref:Uncharacterized protein n=1 Tax=Naganishia vaughanmartiniae TaxID=1424756 RepID=A0ACC2XKZ9_9TREE|nr:hypothetical protein QFC22_000844 [Naganishia vaughanmartiniae]